MITRTRVEMVESFRDLIALIRSIFNFFFFFFAIKLLDEWVFTRVFSSSSF